MSNIFFHYIAKWGTDDLPKTVFKQRHSSVLENALAPADFNKIDDLVQQNFPSGLFNAWGAPEKAWDREFENLAKGDHVLLITNPRQVGGIVALCPVRVVIPGVQPALSLALWGSSHFPLIFLFDTVRLDMSWEDMREQLQFKENYIPRLPQLYHVSEERLSAVGGASGFAEWVRNHFSEQVRRMAQPATSGELSDVTCAHVDLTSDANFVGDVNNELQDILESSLGSLGSGLSLTSDAGIRQLSTKARDAAFAILVRRAYGARCAVCGAGARGPHDEVEVESAHIYPKNLNGNDVVQNGVCLCRRHHWAFDVGWFVLGEDCTVVVHDGLPESADYDFIRVAAGKPIRMPDDDKLRPGSIFLHEQQRMR